MPNNKMLTSKDIKSIIDGLRTQESLNQDKFFFYLVKYKDPVFQKGNLQKHLFIRVGQSQWRSDSLEISIDTSDFSVKADRLIELEKWLALQVDACDRLLDMEEKGHNDESLIAKYFFNKEAYMLVLKRINDISNSDSF